MNKLLKYAWMTGLAIMTPITAFAAGDAHGGAHVEGDPMSLITLEMIWAVVLFIIFASILGFVVWPKILGALQAREQKLEGDLVGAETARKDAEAALTEYKAKIAEAQKEAAKVVEEAKKAAETVANKAIADSQAKIAADNERALAEIESAKQQALNDVYAQTAELSTQIAARILKREINAADQQQLVSESLAELTKSGV
jgi:F-type H+-transporting ATPase subunit b